MHILNTDLVNYHLHLEPLKKLTLSLMQFNGKQTTCQHTYSACMCSGLRSTKVSTDGIGYPADVTPRMRMRGRRKTQLKPLNVQLWSWQLKNLHFTNISPVPCRVFFLAETHMKEERQCVRVPQASLLCFDQDKMCQQSAHMQNHKPLLASICSCWL